jgi:inorganic pyrophosphatase
MLSPDGLIARRSVPPEEGRAVDVDVIVEIPKGSRNKYEYDQRLDRIRLDRMLFTSTGYPSDYGFVPNTLAEDGDPIDALVLLNEPTFPGCLVRARIVAVFWMQDERGPDAKLLCVPATDPRHVHLQELEDVPMHQISEIWHFFDIYEALEPGKSAASRGWERREEATVALEDARRRFTEQLASTGIHG